MLLHLAKVTASVTWVRAVSLPDSTFAPIQAADLHKTEPEFPLLCGLVEWLSPKIIYLCPNMDPVNRALFERGILVAIRPPDKITWKI